MNSRDTQILKKILDETKIALDMVEDISKEGFLEDEKLKRAVCMTLINIGELVKNITAETKELYSYVPWREISGLRDMAAHKYQTLRMEDVFTTATIDLPDLKRDITGIL